MKVSVIDEKVKVSGNMTVVVLTAEVYRNHKLELNLVDGVYTSVGKAVCSSEDSFDELTGKRIARSRAYKNLYLQIYLAYNESIDNLDMRLRFSQQSMNKYVHAINAQERDIERLIHGASSQKSDKKKSMPTVRILPSSNHYLDYSREVLKELKRYGLKCDLDCAGSIFGRIKRSDDEAIPFTVIISEYEEDNQLISVRRLGDFEGTASSMPLELFIEKYIKG